VRREYRWNAWNSGHIAEHGVEPAEAEGVVDAARAPWPRYEGNGKYTVRGQALTGRWLQVIFVIDPPGVVYVIHARPLTEREKRATRRRRP
jgi:hypothetical protein